MPTRRRRLTSVAASSMSRANQRAFSRRSGRDIAARGARATDTINPIANRRYVRYTQPRTYNGRSRYQVESRRTSGVAVGRFVGMAH